MMKRKTLQLLTGALLCQPLSAGELQAQEQDKERPNILFILSDDHTSQSWGIYGGILAPYVKNDNIKRLADEGCVLDNCFCTNSISAPSRATILTGCLQSPQRCKNIGRQLRPQPGQYCQTNAGRRLSDSPFR